MKEKYNADYEIEVAQKKHKNIPKSPGYEDIMEQHMSLYQMYFNAILSVIDVENYTLWSKSNEYNREKLERDNRVTKRICHERAASNGLSPTSLQVMMHQYFFADPQLRERYRDTWIKTVVYNQEKLDFFPGAIQTRKLLKAVRNPDL